MKKLLSFLVFSGFILTSSLGFAAFPEGTITFICPYAAGGTADITVRALAKDIEKDLGVTVVIRNTTGGGGTIGAQEIAKAKADGYTIGMLPIGPISMQPHLRKLPYNLDSFTWIGLISDTPMLMISDLKAPWKNFEEFVAYAKANPNKLVYTSMGPGSIAHVTNETIFRKLGLQLKHMPSPDEANAMTAIAGGTAHIYAGSTSFKGFDVQRLAVTSKERLAVLPDVPSVFEMGVSDIPEFTTWSVILAPKNIPQEAADRLIAAVKAAANAEGYKKIMETVDVVPVYMSPEESKAFAIKASEDFKIIMTDLGMVKQ